ncbi:phage baseplate assembly protein V [Desulfosarcina sp. OttesenSCG-928-G10]|nr:phage baseplate assembly protein V [Desulfosarcina sp. OttesenSCG-928-G10]
MVDQSSPEISLTCGGKDWSHKVVSLVVVNELDRIPFMRASLEIDDTEAGAVFKLGAEVEVKAGYGGRLKSIFKGVLTTSGLILKSGRNTRKLEARDKAHVLTVGLHTALYLDKHDGKICNEILSGEGLSGDIPATSPTHKQLQQIYTSNWDFIRSRLQANGLILKVLNGTVKAIKTDNPGSGKTVSLDADTDPVLELEMETENRAWLDEVTVRAWKESSQEEIQQKSGTAVPSFPEDAKGSGTGFQEVLIPHGVETAEMKNLSAGMLWQARWGFVRGRVRVAGMLDVSPTDSLNLSNFQGPANGKTIVWASRLSFSAGKWTHDLQFGYGFFDKLQREREKNGLSGFFQGDLSRIQGLYPAKVMKLSGDPAKGERIQVHIPLLHEANKGVWARVSSLYAGSGRAVVFRPEKDDEVLVGFFGGDPRAPVILGALPSKANPAPDSLAAKDEKNTRKGWVSKKGLILLLNEDDKSITLETPAGQLLTLNDKEGKVVLKDKNGNTLTLDKSGIALKTNKDITLTATGNIALKATGNINLKATQNFTAEGLDATVKGKKGLNLSGQAMGELKSSGILTIKGTLVKIN